MKRLSVCYRQVIMYDSASVKKKRDMTSYDDDKNQLG